MSQFSPIQRSVITRRRLVSLMVVILVLTSINLTSPALAQNPADVEITFPVFPLAGEPGLDTWFLGQPYGNTTGAYRQRFTTYGASGGIHFGLDLSARCGTEILAVADGVVFAVDGPFGSPPHSIMIDHPSLGYASFYGHLLDPPTLTPGQPVEAGQVIGLSGDSLGDCNRRPHLHFEVRDLAHIRKYNAHLFFEVNWDNLALFGPFGRGFQRNLDNPRQWQSLYDQPVVSTGGPIVNDFARTWPRDWRAQ